MRVIRLHGFLIGLLSFSVLEFLKARVSEGESSVYVMLTALLLEIFRAVLFEGEYVYMMVTALLFEIFRAVLFEGEIFSFMMTFVLHVVQSTLGVLCLVMLLEDASGLALPTLESLSLLKLLMAEAGRC